MSDGHGKAAGVGLAAALAVGGGTAARTCSGGARVASEVGVAARGAGEVGAVARGAKDVGVAGRSLGGVAKGANAAEDLARVGARGAGVSRGVGLAPLGAGDDAMRLGAEVGKSEGRFVDLLGHVGDGVDVALQIATPTADDERNAAGLVELPALPAGAVQRVELVTLRAADEFGRVGDPPRSAAGFLASCARTRPCVVVLCAPSAPLECESRAEGPLGLGPPEANAKEAEARAVRVLLPRLAGSGAVVGTAARDGTSSIVWARPAPPRAPSR